MFRKIPTAVPIAILLGAVSAAPAPAQNRSHHVVQQHRHVSSIPCACRSNVDGGYVMRPGQGERQRLGETRALPWTQDPRER
jgi:hypothetical protein